MTNHQPSSPAVVSAAPLVSKLAAVAAGAVLCSWAGCGGSGTADQLPTASVSPACSVSDENTQVLSTMQSWYYWYATLPAVNLASYSSPAALLDALRQQPLDRFSYITTQAEDQAFYGAGQYVGYGLGFALTAANLIQVNQVFPGSPVAQAGLVRGDTVTAINGTGVPTLVSNGQLDSTLASTSPGKAISFTFSDLASVSHTVQLTSAVVTQPTVGTVTTIQSGSDVVGYVLFNSFIDTSVAALDQAFAKLASAGANRLIIDERYNGGGELTVAQHLASLVAGNGFTGYTLGALTYNDKHSGQSGTVTFPGVTSALNLSEVVFITSNSTASASEFIVNSLTPYIKVATVGSPTFGKPVGENGFSICGDVLYPITFKITNSVGYGDYFSGIPATCAAADDPTHPLGDPNEASVAAALDYIATGNCNARASAALREQSRAQGATAPGPRRYGMRQLINAY